MFNLSIIEDLIDKKREETAMSVDNPATSEKQPEPSCSEAEVRLVVRFIVEEQIVYNGKIEKVNQLEQEELTRIVSRIAWDGAKDRANTSSDLPETPKDINPHLKTTESNALNETVYRSLSKTNSLDMPSSSGASTSYQFNDNSSPGNTSSNNHISSVIDERTTKKDSHQTIVAQISNSPVVSSQFKLLPLEASDIKKYSSRNLDLCEIIDERTLNDSQKIQEKESSFLSPERDLQELIPDVKDSIKQNAVIESQTIYDTLNDCVRNVELEYEFSDDVPCMEQQQSSSNQEHIMKSSCSLGLSFGSKIDNDVIIVEEHDQIANYDTTEIEETTIPYEVDNNIPSIPALGSHYRGEKKSDIYDNSHSAFKHHIEPKLDTAPVKAPRPPEKKERSDTTATIIDNTNIDNCYNNTNTNKRKAAQNISAKRTRKDSQKDAKTTTKQRRESTDDTTRRYMKNQIDNSLQLEMSPSLASASNVSPQLTNPHMQTSFQNKIFAKWSDNHFYPGTILRQAKGRKFVIGFFDGAQRNVSEMDLIPLRNIEGKQVRVSIANDYCVNALVHNQLSLLNDQPMFNVEYQQDGLIRRCVPMKDIFLTGEQGTPLINQVDKNNAASNFADVDLDNIIYEKRSRKQELEDHDLADKESGTVINQTTPMQAIVPTTTGSKRKSRSNQYNTRTTNQSRSTKDITKTTTTNSTIIFNDNPCSGSKKLTRQPDSRSNNGSEIASSPDTNKINSFGPNSNSPSEGSSPIVTTSVPHDMELDQGEFYYSSSSPHRTKTSLLL